MMPRKVLLTLIITVVLGTMAVILAAQAAGRGGEDDGELATENHGRAADSRSSVVTPMMSPIADLPNFAQSSLDYVAQNNMLRSGDAEVKLNLVLTPEVLNSLGFGTWLFEPGCVIPLELVILKGDFDVRQGMPASVPADMEIPAAYIVFVYDTRIGEFISMIGDPNGAIVKQALNDPSLPEASEPFNPTHGLAIPCDPNAIDIPGASEEDVTIYETQEAETPRQSTP